MLNFLKWLLFGKKNKSEAPRKNRILFGRPDDFLELYVFKSLDEARKYENDREKTEILLCSRNEVVFRGTYLQLVELIKKRETDSDV